MDRCKFIGTVVASAVAASHPAKAQPADKVWRVGYIGTVPPTTTPEAARLRAAFREAMQDRGYEQALESGRIGFGFVAQSLHCALHQPRHRDALPPGLPIELGLVFRIQADDGSNHDPSDIKILKNDIATNLANQNSRYRARTR